MNISWLVYLNLENELKECFNYVYFNDNDNQLKVYSNKFADILLRASIEIETLMKELYRRNGGTRLTNRIKYDDECLSHLEAIFALSKKVVIISYPFYDFKNEDSQLIHPFSHFCMTDSNEWNKSYQEIKHDKLKNYKKGNLKNALRSLAALYLLNVYFKDEKYTLKYPDVDKFDNRFGSSLFSLRKPSDKTGLFANPFISDESVYEYKMTAQCQKEYEQKYKQYTDRFLNFIGTIPEMRERAFANIFTDLSRKFSGLLLIHYFCNALAKYRIDASFSGLTTEDKYKLLQAKIGGSELITENNYEANYMNLVFKESMELNAKFPPIYLTYALNDSFCQLSIIRSDS